MIALAVATGIPMSEWAEAGEQAMVTALELLEQQRKDDEPE